MKYLAILFGVMQAAWLVAACSSDSSTPAPTTAADTPTVAATATNTVTPSPTAVPATPTPAYAACRTIPDIVGTAGRTVTAPAAGVPAAVAAFSGAWEGNWGEGAQAAPSVLIVQTVTPSTATTLYVFRGTVSPMALQLTDGKFQASGGGVTFVWSLSADGKTLTGVRTQGGSSVTATMSRCTP